MIMQMTKTVKQNQVFSLNRILELGVKKQHLLTTAITTPTVIIGGKAGSEDQRLGLHRLKASQQASRQENGDIPMRPVDHQRPSSQILRPPRSACPIPASAQH